MVSLWRKAGRGSGSMSESSSCGNIGARKGDLLGRNTGSRSEGNREGQSLHDETMLRRIVLRLSWGCVLEGLVFVVFLLLGGGIWAERSGRWLCIGKRVDELRGSLYALISSRRERCRSREMLARSPGTFADCRKPRQSSPVPKSTLNFITFSMSLNKHPRKCESIDADIHGSRRLCYRYDLVEEIDKTCRD